MIVIDASVAVAALLNAGPARRAIVGDQLHVPHLIDSEIANALRRNEINARIGAASARLAVDAWRRLGVIRYPVIGLIERVWQLRGNLTAYDASYVALAESLDCALLTCDGRLAGTPRLRCPITVLSG
ncbi:MAG: type II toxin-antitoxin system VapC family toxin [Candidatus Dormibacteraceae bacterium]